MNVNKLLVVAGVVVFVLATAACDHIHEPWVNGENDLRQERDRTPQQTDQLRHRIAYTQIDR